MSCEEYLEWISRQIDGDLTPEEQTQLQRHLAECAACREILAAYQAISDGVALLEAEPPEELVENVMSCIERPTGIMRKKNRFAFGGGIAITAAAAVLALAVGTGLISVPGMNDSAELADFIVADAEAGTQKETEMQTTAGSAAETSAPETAWAYDSSTGTTDIPAAADPAEPAEYASEEAALLQEDAPRVRQNAENWAFYAEIYGYDPSNPIEELDLLERIDTYTYCGTAAEILQIVKKYEQDYSISFSSAADYAEDDAACLVLVE